jgi:flagellar hook-associated protein 1 FlgK
MSLFSSIQTSNTGLQAAQVGLQVVGNNIANANTPGYIRQRLEQTPSIATRSGALLLGHGVRTTGVVQMIDKALAERVNAASNSVAGGQTLDKAYSQLESLVGTLDGGGIPEQLTLFNNSLHDLTTQPADRSLREFVVLQGEALARTIRTTYQKATDRQAEFNADLKGMSEQINRQLARVARLNVEIATVEGGGSLGSDATGLREQRYAALEELSQFVELNVQEQASGAVSVFVGGDYLVAEGNFREVYTAYSEADEGFQIRIKETDSPLQSKGGVLGATIQARTEVFGSFLEDLNQLAEGLARAMNDVHSQGQGRVGFNELTGTNRAQRGVPLRDAQLPFAPVNGTFEISVVDTAGKVISKHNIPVRVLNQTSDSTLDSIAADINAISGLTANITSEGRLAIGSESQVSFVFGEDTSGFVAATGLNTFFTGSGASDIDVNPIVKANSDYLAISQGGIGQDTQTLTQMVDLIDRPLDALAGKSVRDIFESNVAVLGQKVSLQRSITDGATGLYETLKSQHLAITGVNIDEESLKLITYNRAFQASARVISVASEMLDILVNL